MFIAIASSSIAADFTRGTGSATSSVKMFRGDGTTANEVSVYRGNGAGVDLIVGPTAGTCSSTPFFKLTARTNSAEVADSAGYEILGAPWGGSARTLCQVDVYVGAKINNISALSYEVRVYSANGNNLGTRKGTSTAVSGSSFPDVGNYVAFTFSSPVTLNAGDIITVSRTDDGYGSAYFTTDTDANTSGSLDQTYYNSATLEKRFSYSRALDFKLYGQGQ